MIGFLPGTTPASLYDEFKTLASPYVTFFSEGRIAPRSEAMDQNIRSIIGDQMKQTGKTSGVIGYSDFDKTQTPGTEFPNAGALLSNMLRGNISPAEFANATTQGRMTYNVNPETGKVTFGSTTFNFRPEVANQGGIFGAFAKGANERNIDIAPNITIPVDQIRGFGRDFSQFDQARMGGTNRTQDQLAMDREIATKGIMNNPELLNKFDRSPASSGVRQTIGSRIMEGLGSIRDTVTDKLGSIGDFIKSGGVLGNVIKAFGPRGDESTRGIAGLNVNDVFNIDSFGSDEDPTKDPYGINIVSGFGNYNEYVKNKAQELAKMQFRTKSGQKRQQFYLDAAEKIRAEERRKAAAKAELERIMSAQNRGTTDYGITRGIDYSDAQAVADAIDRSTPEDFTGGAGGIGGQVTED